MKKGRNSNDVDGLLDAVLVDSEWQAVNSALRGEALAVIGNVRRKRRLRLAIAQITSTAVLLLAAFGWLSSSNHGQAPATDALRQPVRSDAGGLFISEEQMLAMFPPGSCVVAEVDGEKELIFFDAEKAHEGFIVSAR